MVLTYAKKINNKIFRARARTRLENRTDPNPLITGRLPKPVEKRKPGSLSDTKNLRRSATEAQLGLELKVELECALESEVESGLKFESPS